MDFRFVFGREGEQQDAMNRRMFFLRFGLLLAGGVMAGFARADDESSIPPVKSSVVLSADERSAFDRLVGVCSVTLKAVDIQGRPLPGATIRAFSEDWRLYWPEESPTKTNKDGVAITVLPRGNWSFFVSWQGLKLGDGPTPLVAYVELNRKLDKDSEIILQPKTNVALTVLVDGTATRALHKLAVAEKRYANQVRHLMAFTDIPLPAAIQMNSASDLAAVFLTAAGRQPRVFGEVENLRPGAANLSCSSATFARLDVEPGTYFLPHKRIALQLYRGAAMQHGVADTFPVIAEIKAREQILVQPGHLRLRYRIETGEHALETCQKAFRVEKQETIHVRPGSPLEAHVFHRFDAERDGKQNVLQIAAGFLDTDGFLMDRWARQGRRRELRRPAIELRVRQDGVEVAHGELPPVLKVKLDGVTPRPQMDRLEYVLNVSGTGNEHRFVCRGEEAAAIGTSHATVNAPSYLRDNAMALASTLERIAPEFDKVIPGARGREKHWVVWCRFSEGGARASVRGQRMGLPLSVLENMPDTECYPRHVVVELPHCYGFGHHTISRLFLWTPLKAELTSIIAGPFFVNAHDYKEQWSATAFFDHWSGKRSDLDARTFPSLYLYRKYGFRSFQAYIEQRNIFEEQLSSLGFSEGEALCAAYSECSGEDMITLFRISGWNITAKRVAEARRALQSVPGFRPIQHGSPGSLLPAGADKKPSAADR